MAPIPMGYNMAEYDTVVVGQPASRKYRRGFASERLRSTTSPEAQTATSTAALLASSRPVAATPADAPGLQATAGAPRHIEDSWAP